MLPAWWPTGLAELIESARHADALLLVRWLAQGLAQTTLIAFADLLAGAGILALLRARLPARLRGAASLAIGAGVSGSLIFALGCAGVLRPALSLAPAILGVPLLFTQRGRWRLFGWMPALRPRGWLAAVFAFVLALHVVDLAMPPVDYDSTMYHMAAARTYLETRSLDYQPGLRFNAHPHLATLLYLRQMALVDDSLVKMANLEFLAILALALMHAARVIGAAPAIVLLLVGMSPLYWHLMKLEYSDFMLSAWFTTAAVLLAWRGSAAWVGGLALGFATAAKLQGLVMAACLGIVYLALFRHARRAAIVAGLVVLCGAGWWTRSYLATGSPMAPFFFDSSAETEELWKLNSLYGTGGGIAGILALPWRLLTDHPSRFADAFIFGPGLLVWIASVWRVRTRPALLWAGTTLLYLAFWFVSGQVGRYLAVLIPMFSLVRLPRAFVPVLAVCATAASLTTLATIRFSTLPPVTFAQKDIFLAESLPYYRAVRELNRIALPRDRTYLWFAEDARSYVQSRAEGEWFGPWSFRQFDNAGALRAAGFRWILVDRQRAALNGKLYGEEFAASGLVHRWRAAPNGLSLIYDDERYSVFRLE